MTNPNPVAIIGAGPYGLSIAAHCRSLGIAHRIFGKPMETWTTGMPEGMFLKSWPFATSIADPRSTLSLKTFCEEQNVAYDPVAMPLPLGLFSAYGQAFQRRLVPQLEDQFVRRVSKVANGFRVTLDDGETFVASRVIVATGIRQFGSVPDALKGLPDTVLSHSCESGDLRWSKGKDVVVLGGGSSAVDVAASLHRAGARVSLAARGAALRFPPSGVSRKWYSGLTAPMTPLGPGWNKMLAWKGPRLFHLLPWSLRREIVRRYLGPSPTVSVKETVEAHVTLAMGCRISGASLKGGRLRLEFQDRNGARALQADHVVAATGYAIRLERLSFIDRDLVGSVACRDGYPDLSRHFESSVPGLYFVGTPAAMSFGPIMRFVCGTGFCATTLTRHVARRLRLDAIKDAAPYPVGEGEAAFGNEVAADV